MTWLLGALAMLAILGGALEICALAFRHSGCGSAGYPWDPADVGITLGGYRLESALGGKILR